jgi:hypothetical protein
MSRTIFRSQAEPILRTSYGRNYSRQRGKMSPCPQNAYLLSGRIWGKFIHPRGSRGGGNRHFHGLPRSPRTLRRRSSSLHPSSLSRTALGLHNAASSAFVFGYMGASTNANVARSSEVGLNRRGPEGKSPSAVLQIGESPISSL